ncbi:peroxide stress protein YaaA [Nocardiopsis sp. MG754419]|uniref:peroxide stress protein YaaA n=1 Tax=Nocardiopsis sp. MG754419 TaxID=2259865 RepID=UPI001BAD44E6|nr:peroxide stress protein YaaA [Nocardiopsis sp. MG754419]MBR8740331.1 peroxide stress protein YaaA [Nocardiopsis sp. MG754419]
MLILLPPSEGKATSGDGPGLDVGALTLPELAADRERVMAALTELCAGPEDTAREVLGLSVSQNDALKRNLDLAAAPTLRAADLYTGVLYDRLGLSGLLDEHGDRVRERILVFSGLWGVVGPADRLPPYRLSMGVKLPPLGGLGAYWRRALTEPLGASAEGRLLVDCRSASYAAAFKPTGEAAERTVAVRVLREREVDGHVKRSVVSHMAKATRGDIARVLVTENVEARTPEELVAALRDLGHTVELPPAGRPGTARTMDVVVRD